jgi:hypothetical protein
VRLEGLGQLKNPVTPLGIEPTICGLKHGASTDCANVADRFKKTTFEFQEQIKFLDIKL